MRELPRGAARPRRQGQPPGPRRRAGRRAAGQRRAHRAAAARRRRRADGRFHGARPAVPLGGARARRWSSRWRAGAGSSRAASAGSPTSPATIERRFSSSPATSTSSQRRSCACSPTVPLAERLGALRVRALPGVAHDAGRVRGARPGARRRVPARGRSASRRAAPRADRLGGPARGHPRRRSCARRASRGGRLLRPRPGRARRPDPAAGGRPRLDPARPPLARLSRPALLLRCAAVPRPPARAPLPPRGRDRRVAVHRLLRPPRDVDAPARPPFGRRRDAPGLAHRHPSRRLAAALPLRADRRLGRALRAAARGRAAGAVAVHRRAGGPRGGRAAGGVVSRLHRPRRVHRAAAGAAAGAADGPVRRHARALEGGHRARRCVGAGRRAAAGGAARARRARRAPRRRRASAGRLSRACRARRAALAAGCRRAHGRGDVPRAAVAVRGARPGDPRGVRARARSRRDQGRRHPRPRRGRRQRPARRERRRECARRRARADPVGRADSRRVSAPPPTRRRRPSSGRPTTTPPASARSSTGRWRRRGTDAPDLRDAVRRRGGPDSRSHRREAARAGAALRRADRDHRPHRRARSTGELHAADVRRLDEARPRPQVHARARAAAASPAGGPTR